MKTSGVNFVITGICAALLLLLVTCAPQEASIPASKVAPTVATETVPTKADWEVEWEKTLAAAKKEGRVNIIVAGPGASQQRAMSEAFQSKFEIPVEMISGMGAAVSTRIINERKAGIYNVDVYVGGTSTPVAYLKPKEVLEPLGKIIFRPDVLDEKAWRLFGLYFDREHMLAGGFGTVQPIIAVNPDLIKTEEIRSYKDLLLPKFKGKIVLGNATSTGPSLQAMQTLNNLMGESFLWKLAEQEPVIASDWRLHAEWVVCLLYTSPSPRD